MATATDYQRLRDDIGANSTTLSDAEAALIYAEAEETYTDAATIYADVRVIALRRIWASSAKLTSYRQNATTEDLSDVFKHLGQLLNYWEGQREAAVLASSTSSAARFGSMRQKPARIKEYPNA